MTRKLREGHSFHARATLRKCHSLALQGQVGLQAYDADFPPSIPLHELVGQPQVKRANYGEPDIE
eukprot:2886288-Amphidinium_carterae.2